MHVFGFSDYKSSFKCSGRKHEKFCINYEEINYEGKLIYYSVFCEKNSFQVSS